MVLGLAVIAVLMSVALVVVAVRQARRLEAETRAWKADRDAGLARLSALEAGRAVRVYGDDDERPPWRPDDLGPARRPRRAHGNSPHNATCGPVRADRDPARTHNEAAAARKARS